MIPLLILTLGCAPKKPTLSASPDGRVTLSAPAPLPSGPVSFEPPVAQVLPLATGGELWLLPRDGLPLVSLRLLVPGGKALSPGDKPGLVAFSDTMLEHGAGERDAQAFAAALDQLAADLSVSTTDTWTIVSLDVHSDRIEPALDLLADLVLRPRFEPAEVERLRELRKAELQSAMDDPRTVATWVSERAWYGEGHPLALPAIGTLDSLDQLGADELRASWESRRAAAAPRLVVAGDVQVEALTASIAARLDGWEVTGPPAASPPPPAAVPSLLLVDNPGASQTMLMVTLPGPGALDESVHGARLGAVVLGGTFTSRLNRLLREEKGYTYGASARLRAGPTDGRIVVGTSVQKDVTGPALVDLLGEIDRLHLGLSTDELDKARGSNLSDLVEEASTRSSLADSAAELLRLSLPPEALSTRIQAEAEQRPEQALAALSRSRTANGTVVVVGDLSQVRAAVLEAVPGAWVEVDRQGAPR